MSLAAALALLALAADVPAPEPPRVLALVIGSNDTRDASLPPLRYADDDAIRFGTLLTDLDANAIVEVLTRPDAETTRLLDDRERALLSGAPRVADVEAAVTRLAAKRAASVGRRTALYIVFAGHGDAEAGKGALSLEDGALTRADLERAIERVGADVTHLLLDACNSFFLVHSRRPGGRTFVTSPDPKEALRSEHSDVGIFLSTSAEAQVYEWSQLQGGIFSHTVRSGLRGAADIDGDGRISYGELEAFLARATALLVNEAYIPRVFARAPSSSDVLFDLRSSPSRRLRLEELEGKLTIRDGRGVRLVDVHPEPGFSPTLWLPREPGLTLEGERTAATGGGIIELSLDDKNVLSAADLPAATLATRGGGALFRQLYAAPWGPNAFAAERARPTPVVVYGLTRAQEARLLLQLRWLADEARTERLVSVGTSLTLMTTSGIAAGALALSAYDERSFKGAGTRVLAALYAVSGLTIGLGTLLAALSPRSEEQAYAALVAVPASTPAERQAKVVGAVDTLTGYAEADAFWRQVLGWTALGVGAAALVGGAIYTATAPELSDRVDGSSFVLMAA